MDLGIAGKWALVCGASKGLGYGCAQALVAHGMPTATPDPAHADTVLLDGQRKQFSDEVRNFLLGTAPGE